ncbi:septum formation family protein [Actinomadura luteofluorescens]|uniref:septum formation family protein n=1 Tax=Actinomadura luteofluorescens TaxID=46163 RepID=UPI0034851368
MTTPPPPDDVPETTAPTPAWAPPDTLASTPAAPTGPSFETLPAAEHGPAPLTGGPAPVRKKRIAVVLAATAVVTLAAVVAGSIVWPRHGESGRDREGGEVAASALRAGDCFEGGAVKPTDTVTVVPCTRPHTNEVVARPVLPDEPYPGSMEVYLQAKELCSVRGMHLMKSRHYEDLEAVLLGGDEQLWVKGDRSVTCVMHYRGAAGPLTTPLAQTIDPSRRFYQELRVGDCVAKEQPEVPLRVVVACTEPHESQVYATGWIELDGDYAPGDYPPYPGQSAVQKKTLRLCDERGRKVFAGGSPPDGLQIHTIAPAEVNWRDGIRAMVCMVQTMKAPLRRSVLP